MTRKCTEAKRCHRTTCYDCRRYLIDTTAARMLEQGMSQGDVDRYRYPAINALALEIPAKAPEAPKARKAPVTVEPELVEATLKALRQCSSRVSARPVLKVLTMAQLKAVAKALEMGACSRYRKDELIEHLIDFTVQMKLDHDAILNAR